MLKLVRCTAYLALPLALGGSAATFAQQPGLLPQPGASLPAHSTTVAPVAQGTVARFIINPPGEVDGLLLSDGTQVRFPSHMSAELVAAIRVGDPVSIQGFLEYQGAVKAFVVINARTNQSVVEHEPTSTPLPPHLRNVGLNALSAEGRIQYLMYGPRGELNGVMLDNGGIVRFPPDVGYQFASVLQVGQPIIATGYGTRNQYGRALEATAIGMAKERRGRAGRTAPYPTPPLSAHTWRASIWIQWPAGSSPWISGGEAFCGWTERQLTAASPSSMSVGPDPRWTNDPSPHAALRLCKVLSHAPVYLVRSPRKVATTFKGSDRCCIRRTGFRHFSSLTG